MTAQPMGVTPHRAPLLPVYLSVVIYLHELMTIGHRSVVAIVLGFVCATDCGLALFQHCG